METARPSRTIGSLAHPADRARQVSTAPDRCHGRLSVWGPPIGASVEHGSVPGLPHYNCGLSPAAVRSLTGYDPTVGMATGERLAGFRIVRPLGTGGVGEMNPVEHPRLPRQEVLKVLSAELSTAVRRQYPSSYPDWTGGHRPMSRRAKSQPERLNNCSTRVLIRVSVAGCGCEHNCAQAPPS